MADERFAYIKRQPGMEYFRDDLGVFDTGEAHPKDGRPMVGVPLYRRIDGNGIEFIPAYTTDGRIDGQMVVPTGNVMMVTKPPEGIEDAVRVFSDTRTRRSRS